MIRSYYIAIAGAVAAVGILVAGLQIVHSEWRAGYTTLFQVLPRINWINYYTNVAVDRLTRPLIASDLPGLPQVNLYISKKSQSSLMSDLPNSVKEWQKSYYLYPDGSLRKIKIRHRGDNPFNWFFEKKSWRIKTSKKRLLGNRRSINLVSPQEGDFVSEYMGYWIGRQVGVLSSPARIVETFINDKPNGVYLEIDRLDESFLRNAGFMPVNLYKGEQYNSERAFQLDNDLFNNPTLWTKSAISNARPKDDFGDLSKFFSLIRNAETSIEDFRELLKIAPLSVWGRFAAFQILLQSWGNSSEHNMRLVADNWRGMVYPVTHDTVANFASSDRFILDSGSHPLLSFYSQNSEFLLKKYEILHEQLREKKLFKKTKTHLAELFPKLLISLSRDGNRHQLALNAGGEGHSYISTDNIESQWRQILESTAKLESWLKNELEADPDVSWKPISNGIELVVGGTSPVGSLSFAVKTGKISDARALFWDADENGKISTGDLSLPTTVLDNKIVVKAKFLANRVRFIDASKSFSDATKGSFEIRPTRFRLLGIKGANIKTVFAANALTKKTSLVIKDDRPGATPGRWNWPVVKAPILKPEIWSGEIAVSRTRVLDHPVQINAGTKLKLSPGVSLIFRNKLEVLGTGTQPVLIYPAIDDKPWGTVALQGQGTAHSRIKNLKAVSGSGAMVNGINYTAMISVHDSADVLIDGIDLRTNHTVDDMLHVVYSKNVRMQNFILKDALSDAIDIDISEIKILNGKISNSGNDGIDLMSSGVLIQNVIIDNSGDKGISVGEKSNALVYSSVLKNNKIGVESKDASQLRILQSELVGNKLQVSAYRKNWRYGRGGFVSLNKSVVIGSNDSVKIDKKSQVLIFDSMLNPLPKKSKRIKIDSYSDSRLPKEARSGSFAADHLVLIKKYKLKVAPEKRGNPNELP
jgi:hypothetical protein